MEEYNGKAKSYEDAKLKAITAVLATIGIEITDEMGKVTITKDGDKVATLEISI